MSSSMTITCILDSNVSEHVYEQIYHESIKLSRLSLKSTKALSWQLKPKDKGWSYYKNDIVSAIRALVKYLQN